MKITATIALFLFTLLALTSCGGGNAYVDEMNRSLEQIEWQMNRINSSMKKLKNNIPRDKYDDIKWFVEALEKSSDRIASEVDDIIGSENEAGNFAKTEVGDVKMLLEEVLKELSVFRKNTDNYLQNKSEEQINPELIKKLLKETDKFSSELMRLDKTLDKLKAV